MIDLQEVSSVFKGGSNCLALETTLVLKVIAYKGQG